MLRFYHITEKDYQGWPDEKTEFIILTELCPSAKEKYCNYILPAKPGNITFEENLRLSKISSIFLYFLAKLKSQNERLQSFCFLCLYCQSRMQKN